MEGFWILGQCPVPLNSDLSFDAPESTTDYLSSGFVDDGAGNDQTSEGEYDVASSLSSSLWTFSSISHASLRAHWFLPETCPQISEPRSVAHQNAE